jgi:hypothetical protein
MECVYHSCSQSVVGSIAYEAFLWVMMLVFSVSRKGVYKLAIPVHIFRLLHGFFHLVSV